MRATRPQFDYGIMKWLIITLFVATLCADIYIYRSVVSRYLRSSPLHIVYITGSILMYIAIVAAFFLYFVSTMQTSAGLIAVMWCVWFFVLGVLPKLVFAAGGMLDFLARSILRRRITFFRWLGTLASLSLVAVMIYGATAGRTKLRVEEVEICSPRIPAAFDGYRVVQITDFHVGSMCHPGRRLGRLAETVNAQKPDLVVNTGDVVSVNHRELTSKATEVLSRISAKDGVLSVWGNHDLGFYIKDTIASPLIENHAALTSKIEGMGWTILSDESRWIYRTDTDGGRDSILVTGIDYPTTRLNGYNNTLGGADIDKAFRGFDTEPYNIVLSHTPDLWREITGRNRGDLTLSGHTHAMQMKLRLFGKMWSPAQYIYSEWSGKYIGPDAKNRLLYVNDGIGCVGYPMRLGALPEITVFILKRCE